MTDALPEFWWRVEVDADGVVVSCEQVDEAKKGTTHVRYLWGASRAAVQKDALEWHERHRKYQSVSAKRLAAKRRAAGQCRHCTAAICADSSYLCTEHLERHRRAQRRFAAGESKTRKLADPVQLKKRHLADHRLRTRLGEQLPELLARYDELDGTPSPFRAWLVHEISVREGGHLRLVPTGT